MWFFEVLSLVRGFIKLCRCPVMLNDVWILTVLFRFLRQDENPVRRHHRQGNPSYWVFRVFYVCVIVSKCVCSGHVSAPQIISTVYSGNPCWQILSPRCSVTVWLPERIKITIFAPPVPSAGPALITFPATSYSARTVWFMSDLWQHGDSLLGCDVSSICGGAEWGKPEPKSDKDFFKELK